MLKSLPQSGWFHPHPRFNRVVVAILIVAPVLSISAYFSLARQSQVKIDKSASESGESKDLSGFNSPSAKLGTSLPVTQTTNRSSSVLSQSKISNKKQNAIKLETENMLGVKDIKESASTGLNRSATYNKGVNHPKSKNLPNQSIATGVIPSEAGSSQIVPTEEQVSIPNGVPADPINSPHPIPWKWIVMTQEAIGGQGRSGVRQYRSTPVVSPDGRYAVYSRVQLEVEPEMHNSQVSSLLFIEDRQTKRLNILAKTSDTVDMLSKNGKFTPETNNQGKIGILVPVSWSEKGDQLLARKFVGTFNTADVTDNAVIWNRQQNTTTTVVPPQGEGEHEKIAILLGWSKKQPNYVLFRSGELGEENWPLVQVSGDGKNISMNISDDQPITFGNKGQSIWLDPEVAAR
ncbi:hypothetical protein [Cylindrospermopsis raciborskii]|uniref:Uncharacterized protein n=1 Tax=Cylindrospermopsis raciborskii CENA302 TaxID=1170768 RepID=A0A9Q5QYW5_9CYAN|nr:hypothetical protein [Cylindrospermopsis raciborskii]NLQ06453.1 hypothetical protein [Cylindrospermopsis raciborskii MVCC19]OHY32089.1 hypothetical protein BCV64_14170 [Cylindrospermopsis raciborskii MVCC14]OPH10712.1 hypothetical protein CENA302_03460 [Cylindrospermopsis raciborskii CENA302]